MLISNPLQLWWLWTQISVHELDSTSEMDVTLLYFTTCKVQDYISSESFSQTCQQTYSSVYFSAVKILWPAMIGHKCTQISCLIISKLLRPTTNSKTYSISDFMRSLPEARYSANWETIGSEFMLATAVTLPSLQKRKKIRLSLAHLGVYSTTV